jgi:hypothetical protein
MESEEDKVFYSFFGWFPSVWSFPYRRFGTHCLYQLHRSFEQSKGKNIAFKTRRKVWNEDKVLLFLLLFLLLLLLLSSSSSFVSSMTSLFLMIQVLWDITLCLWVSSCDVSKDRNVCMFSINCSALHSYILGLLHPDNVGETIARNAAKYLTT